MIQVLQGVTKMKKIILCSFALALASCSDSNAEASKTVDQVGRPVSLAISTDGNYAISVNANKHAYLWNLEKHTSKPIDGDFNVKSAYFVPNTNYYMLQNEETKQVIVSDINQKVIKEFTPDFIAKSEAINHDLTTWVGATEWGDAYQYNLPSLEKKQIYISWYMAKNNHNEYWNKNRPDGSIPASSAMGAPIEINFIDNDKYALTTDSNLTVYDIKEKEWTNTRKNSGATMNAIDPSGQFVYTADQQYGGIKYNLKNNKTDQDLFYFPSLEENKSYELRGQNKAYYFNGISNFKFIDKDRIIATFKGVSQSYLWAGLFKPSDYKKSGNHDTTYSIKYLPLTKDPMKFIKGNYRDNTDPFPMVTGYNTIFDTSVEAHKLVMAQANGNGIMVYNYNPSDESLKLDWVGVPPKVEEKKESKGWFW